VTYPELAEQLQTALAEAREEGRQEERKRASRLSPVADEELRRILQHADPVPELQARLGARVDSFLVALQELLYAVESTGGPVDLLGAAAVLRARALLLSAGLPLPAVPAPRPHLQLVPATTEEAAQ